MNYPFNMSKSANTANRGTVVTVKPLQLQLPNPFKTCIYCNTVNPLYEGLQLQLQRDNSVKGSFDPWEHSLRESAVLKTFSPTTL